MPAQSSGAAAVASSSSGIDGKRVDRRDHVVGIAAVIVEAGDFEIAAGNKVAAPAAIADEAGAAEPADADALPDFPGGDVGADGVDPPGDLVARHGRVMHAGKGAGRGEHVAMADAAGLDLDAHLARAGLGGGPLDKLERRVGFGDLDNAHEGTPWGRGFGLPQPKIWASLSPLKIDCTASAASRTPNTRTITFRAVTPMT